MAATIDALKPPDSKLAREIAELVRDTETPLLFHHSSRVYHWGALTGRRHGLRFELGYETRDFVGIGNERCGCYFFGEADVASVAIALRAPVMV
jgi:hypothetical protein